MSKAQVRFLPDDVTAEVDKGRLLLDVALEAGVFIPAACGGAGACGQCKVRINEGEVETLKVDKLDREAKEAGYVLACQAKVTGDVTVEVPAARVGRKVIPRDEADRMTATATPMESPIVPANEPMTMRVYLEAPPPSAEDNMSDFERIVRTLKVNHDISPVTATLGVLRDLPPRARENDWKMSASVLVEHVPDCHVTMYRLCDIHAGHVDWPPTAVALDIGTTSLWAELVNLETGEVLARASRYNPQMAMGDDVISRIVFSLKKDGLGKLQAEVVKGINELIEELLQKTGLPRDSIDYMVAAGNTVMTHLFLGLNCKYLRESPYVPAVQHVGPVPAEALGLAMPKNTFVRVIPGVASYVGGDIVSGVLANGMWDSDAMTLFIDIGTNGEIVAGNRDLLMTASCSAGPAFEGGGLEHGMRAAPGAVEGVLLDPETLEPMIRTMDTKPPVGICGSGIINIISQFLRTGILNKNGKFSDNHLTDRIRNGRSGMEYLICGADQSGNNSDITLSEVDLDNIIRAKGAMFSGYTCLLDKVGLSVGDLDRVIIAGAFGSFINLEHAVTIGLLPDIDRDKFSFIGNSSLKGARLCALDKTLYEKAGEIARTMTNVELSEDVSYMDNFMAALFFPHTRQELFPSVQF